MIIRTFAQRAAAVLAAVLIAVGGTVQAGDLDDGIGIDEKIDDSLQSGPNLTFIVNHAKSKARQSNSENTIRENGAGNITIGAGSDLKGATIINLSDNEDAAVVSE